MKSAERMQPMPRMFTLQTTPESLIFSFGEPSRTRPLVPRASSARLRGRPAADPQQRAASAWIAVDFLRKGATLAAHELEARLRTHGQHRKIRQHRVDFGLLLHEAFDDPILERSEQVRAFIQQMIDWIDNPENPLN